MEFTDWSRGPTPLERAATGERKGDWMQTASGRQYWPLDPRADEVCAYDIAHHLSLLCRYCGASRRHYSVAEHTLGVLYVGDREAVRRGFDGMTFHLKRLLLLHDAPEAYCHDLIRPIKRCVTGYDAIEEANYRAILAHFGIDHIHDLHDLIKQADNAMLLAEQAVLMKPAPAKWAPVVVPEQMRRDAERYLRRARWKVWRRWSWWNRRAFLREMKRLGLHVA